MISDSGKKMQTAEKKIKQEESVDRELGRDRVAESWESILRLLVQCTVTRTWKQPRWPSI